ncbi:MAG: hypothetical protein FD174_2642 [Geobacteraceae bacterium]|nr:MAG: hypothetical protein FD174_2642 [Geobacteraceae bacterium]
MEIVGGFMVMLSILGFFLTVVWLIFPFVVFAMKGKLDRAYLLLEEIDRRLAAVEESLKSAPAPREEPISQASAPHSPIDVSLPPSAGE